MVFRQQNKFGQTLSFRTRIRELNFTLQFLGEWKAKMMKNPAYNLGYITSEEYQRHKKAAADDKAALLL